MGEDQKPFNDVIDHFNKVEGNASNLGKASLKKYPRGLKFFGFFIVVFFSITIILMIILNLLN
ncbi:hypothetical protein [Neobacillus cucumis]|uniref:hypothetical protein n=1 Tax=Neobacillus cucumis TaxID=1740721 RepID=UPI002E1DC045|nr:hypothetical protein [Neobacillus cucumis]